MKVMKITDKAGDRLTAGAKLYEEFKPRPVLTRDEMENGTPTPNFGLWMGWMLARTKDINSIFNWIKALKLPEKEYEKRISAAVRTLDISHGLNPDVRDEYGQSTLQAPPKNTKRSNRSTGHRKKADKNTK